MNEWKKHFKSSYSKVIDIDDSTEDNIDIKSLVQKFSRHWYYFILSVLICLFIAFLYNRYSTNIYKVYTLLKIESKEENAKTEALEAFEFFDRTDVENEKIRLTVSSGSKVWFRS